MHPGTVSEQNSSSTPATPEVPSLAVQLFGTEKPWFAQGLRFQCTQCGNCCTGEPGYVWVNRQELEAIAQYLGEPLEEVQRYYTRKVGIRRSLIEFPDGDCVFFDSQRRKCTIYPVRPRQCRSWPFWVSNLRREEDWQRTCQQCPGCGQGELVPLEEILQQAAKIRV